MTKLLLQGDKPAVEIINPDSQSPLLLVCEHAGNLVPKQLNNLGISHDDLQKHIGWDIGAETLARTLAEKFGATLIIQNYSRLVIDCNRPTDSPTSMPAVSDDIPIPANQNLSDGDRQARIDEIFSPYDNALQNIMDKKIIKFAVPIHSYTRMMADGKRRPWDVGFLVRNDLPFGEFLKQHYLDSGSTLTPEVNQPYEIEDDGDWFVPAYAEKYNLRHALVEVCNDQLLDKQGIDKHADILYSGISKFIGEN